MNQGLRSLVSGLQSGLSPAWAVAGYPVDAAAWNAKHPGIGGTIAAIWNHTATSSPSPDAIGTAHFVAAGTPVFSSSGVTMDDGADTLEIADAATFDPDGATSITYFTVAYLPTYSGAEPNIMSKRDSTTGFPGWGVFMQAGGNLKVTQDGGSSGRQDITDCVDDYQNQIVPIAYTINRTTGFGTLHTPTEERTKALTGVTSMSNGTGLALGRSDPENRSALVGTIHKYTAVITGVAITHAEYLEIIA